MTRLLTRIGAGLGVTALLGGGLLLWARYGIPVSMAENGWFCL